MSNLVSGAISGVVFGCISYLLYRIGFGPELKILDMRSWITYFIILAAIDYFFTPRALLTARLCEHIILITVYLIVYPCLQKFRPRTPPGPKN